MKKVLFIEGGGKEANDYDFKALKDGFSGLLKRISKGSYRGSVTLSGATGAVINDLKNYSNRYNAAALVDHDEPNFNKDKKCIELSISKDLAENVFFMHLEMESWILSQPNAIEKHLKIALGTLPKTTAYKQPKVKEALKTIFKRYRPNQFYNELRDGGRMLEYLDEKQLLSDFEQVQELQKWLNK